MTSLARLDAVAQAELVRRGEVAPRELVEAAVRRIEAMNPLIHAVVALDPDRKQSGDGPFAGVPFLVKDLTPVPGLRWALGARLFRKNMPAPPTPYTTAIEASGLVTIGKTATSEFGLLGSTETLLEGVTHNPWDLSYSAAGSSGGAAAAVAAGLVPFAHANDGGGSIRIPASVCGLFGFKPSRGRTVPATMQPSDFDLLTSEHCISRSVRDSALFLSLTEKPESPVGYVRTPLDRPLRIASFTRTSVGEEPDPEVLAAHAHTVRLLEGLGHHVEPIAAPAIDGDVLGRGFFTIAGATIGGFVQMIPQLRGAPVTRDELEPFTWEVLEAARGADLAATRAMLEAGARQYLEHVAGYDLVLTPTLATGPWRLGHASPVLPHAELMRRMARSVGYTPIHNIAGCPGMSVPLFWTDDGLPIGSHFAAAPGHDALLLQLAYQLEAAQPWHDRWAPWSYPRVYER